MLLGKILGNRYELIEIVGKGGMAIVYKAKDKLLNRFVAIKILRQEFTSDEQFIKKFKRESQSAASLSHQNIVNIYDVGVEEDIHYIVMELADGKTLKSFIKDNISVNWKKSIDIALQIASALGHAHKNQIIHRDIKPHNIIITPDGAVKVTDFGIARAITSSTITQVEDTMGSVHYLSPEQARGGFVNEKSDLYSLGIVLYEMVTGEVPFKGETSVSVALQHLQGEIVPPDEINPSIPKSLNSIILKLLNKNPDDRYTNASYLINDLNRVYIEPDADFIKDYFDDDAPTQISPVIAEEKSINNKKDKKNKKKTNKNLKLTISLIAFFIIASIAGALVFSLGNIFKVKEVEVPNVVNLHIDEAIKELKEKNLDFEIIERKHSSEIEKDFVISQDPVEGNIIKENQIVNLIISNGPRQVTMPSLIGKFEKEAINLIENAGLEIGEVDFEFNEAVENGKVYDQSPKEGVEIEEGQKVDIFVSKGKETFKAPDIRGKHLEEAKQILNSVGLNIGKTDYETSETYEKDHVIKQSPPAKGEVQKNSDIDIVLSKGKITTKNIEVDLTQYQNEEDESQRVSLTIELIDYQDNTVKVVYEKQHSPNEGILNIPVKGTGVQMYIVKVDNKKHSDGIITF